jgi:hypothetical protein
LIDGIRDFALRHAETGGLPIVEHAAVFADSVHSAFFDVDQDAAYGGGSLGIMLKQTVRT